jgi:DNA-directed RNA polymerase specialized sigma24 family protein
MPSILPSRTDTETFDAVAEHIDFDSFVERRSPALVRTLLTRDHDLAEDLVQRTLVKAWAAWKRIRDETSTVDDRSVPWAALARLTHRQRAVIVLRYYEDLPEQLRRGSSR